MIFRADARKLNRVSGLAQISQKRRNPLSVYKTRTQSQTNPPSFCIREKTKRRCVATKTSRTHPQYRTTAQEAHARAKGNIRTFL
jgi:hypothetical protein